MRLPISIIYLFIGIWTFTEDIKIPLHEINQPIIGVRHIAIPVSYNLKSKHVIYTAKGSLFNIKAESKKNHIIYSISHEGDTIKQISFCEDSIAEWSINQTYDVHAVKFKFNQQNYFLIPGTKLQYNDPIYNEFPCMISDGDIKQGCFCGDEIYLLRNGPASAPTLYVKKHGLFHTKESLNGLNYKSEYVFGDTIPLNDKPFLIKKIDWDNSKLLLTPIHNKLTFQKIDSAYFNHLSQYFNNKEYLFIDFWGTWCAPCIHAIPRLKELYVSNKEYIEFLSLCYDAPENHTRFEEILDKYKIEWTNCFIPFNTEGTIISQLNIESFPSFMLIHKHGDIIFFFSGENNIPKIASLLKDYHNSRTLNYE